MWKFTQQSQSFIMHSWSMVWPQIPHSQCIFILYNTTFSDITDLYFFLTNLSTLRIVAKASLRISYRVQLILFFSFILFFGLPKTNSFLFGLEIFWIHKSILFSFDITSKWNLWMQFHNFTIINKFLNEIRLWRPS